MWDLGWLWRPRLPPPPSSLCSRGTPSHGPHPLTLLLSSCFDLCWPESPLPPSLPFCPTSNFFCTALVHSPSNPCGYCCSSVHTNACVCVCVSVSLCSLMLLTVLLTTSSTVQLNLELLNQHIQVLLYINNWATGPLCQDMLPACKHFSIRSSWIL